MAAGVAPTARAAARLDPRAALDAIANSPFAAPGYRQSVARWCFSGTPLDELCRESKRIGLSAIDLLSENEWAEPPKHGLTCAVSNGPGPIPDGWNRADLHDKLVAESERLLPLVAAAGIPQMIVFSGNRRGMSDGEGIANCTAGLKRIMPTAERVGVTVVMEMLNSKVDHTDYHARPHRVGRGGRARAWAPSGSACSTTSTTCRSWRATSSAPSAQYAPLIAHYHTGGVPGRHELDDTQELQLRAASAARSSTPASRATSPTSSSRRASRW